MRVPGAAVGSEGFGKPLRLCLVGLLATDRSLPSCRFKRKYKVKLVEKRAFREIQ